MLVEADPREGKKTVPKSMCRMTTSSYLLLSPCGASLKFGNLVYLGPSQATKKDPEMSYCPTKIPFVRLGIGLTYKEYPMSHHG